MKIKLTTAEAIRLARILDHNSVETLFKEGGDAADADLESLWGVYNEIVDKLEERRIPVETYGGDAMTGTEEG